MFDKEKDAKNVYDDGNIPDVDLPQNKTTSTDCRDCKDCSSNYEVEPLPESSRPRKDGPGGA